MSIGTGTYIIRNAATGLWVGRSEREDKSLRPKSVIVLPPGVQAPFWKIEGSVGGPQPFYRLSIGGSPTGVVDGNRVAALLTGENPADWEIRELDNGTYNILYRGLLWTAQRNVPESPIIVAPFFPGPNPASVFEIIRVDRD